MSHAGKPSGEWFNGRFYLGTDYRSADIPPELCAAIDRWKRESNEQAKTFEPKWEEKLASLYFSWDGREYEIDYTTLDISQELFCCYSAKVMEPELEARGESAAYMGFLW